MTSHLLTSISEGILHIEFNRPDKKNALTLEMYGLAAESLEKSNTDKSVRAIISAGKGESFTSGNDLADFLNAPSDNMNNELVRFLNTLPNCSKPIIAAIHIHAVGIGTTMLLHCDLVYADNSAKLQLPFVNLGLCPEFGSSLLLPQLIGMRRASELLLLGQSINAQTALEYGLINAVVDDVQATAYEQAQALVAKPAAAVRLSKSLLHHVDKEQLMSMIETEANEFNKRMQSPEAKEAMTAFMERRAADFSAFD